MMLYNRTRYLVDHLIHVCLFVCFKGGNDRYIREAFTTPNELEIEEIRMDDEVFIMKTLVVIVKMKA